MVVDGGYNGGSTSCVGEAARCGETVEGIGGAGGGPYDGAESKGRFGAGRLDRRAGVGLDGREG